MRRFAVLVIIILAVWSIPGTCAELSKDAWMAIYLGTAKIGYLHTTITKATLHAKSVYQLRETMLSQLRMEGKKTSRVSTTTIFFDPKFKPIEATYDDVDGNAKTRTEAQYLSDRVECKSIVNGKAVHKSVPIPAGADLCARMKYESGVLPLSPGKDIKLSAFDPDRSAITTETLHYERREEIEFNGVKLIAAVIRHGSVSSEVVDWRLDDGTLAKSEMAGIGAVMLARTKQEAMAGLDNGGPDLDVVRTDRPIERPRQATDLKLRLVGMPDASLAISDSRQVVQYSAATATCHISASPFDPQQSAILPIERTDLAEYLQPTDGIECADEDITRRAREVVGTEKSAYSAACRLRAWVQANVRPSAQASTALSAVAVLKERVGSCRHNAVLYTALARAAGIPSRLAGGLIYDSGAFRFHVWAESWVGEWVALDPTYPGDFCDATHIKLVEGEVKDLPSLGRVAGRLRAEIVSVK